MTALYHLSSPVYKATHGIPEKKASRGKRRKKLNKRKDMIIIKKEKKERKQNIKKDI